MIELLLALNLCAIIAIVSFLGVPPAKDWIVTILPAWMQGIGTVAGVLLAWKAYKDWRRPDDTRRLADFAQVLIRTLTKVEESLYDVTLGTRKVVSGSIPPALGTVIFKAVAEMLALKKRGSEQFEVAISELKTFQPEAQAMFGLLVGFKISNVTFAGEQILSMHRVMMEMMKHSENIEAFSADPHSYEWMKNVCVWLDVSHRNETDTKFNFRGDINCKKMLDDLWEIRRSLATYLLADGAIKN